VIIHRFNNSDPEEDSGMDVPEPELPVLPPPRRDNDISTLSIIAYGLRSDDIDFSSDQLKYGTPEIPRAEGTDLDKIPRQDLTPDDAPPDFRSSIRSVSFSFNDMPTVVEVPDDETSLLTPLGLFFIIDEEPLRDIGSPEKVSATSLDDHLQ